MEGSAGGKRRRVLFPALHVGLSLLTLLPGRVGGSESYVQGLLAAFAGGAGPQQVTVLINRYVAREYAAPTGGIRFHPVQSYRTGEGTAARAVAMGAAAALPRRVARDVPPGIEVLHHPLTVPIPSLRLPTVTTLHDLHHHELPVMFPRAERLYRRWAYDGAARRATIVITPSEYTRSLAIDRLGLEPSRVRAVPWGLDHQRFRPDAGGDAGHPRLPEPYVLYPANLWPHKNHERLVEALATTRGVALVLTGQPLGRLPAVVAAARRAGVADRLIHLGHVPPNQVPGLMAAARAVVFPSLAEGFGLPVLEAMACGTPVVASTAGALPEVCGDAALLADPRSADALGDAIARIVDDEALRARLVAAGRKRAQEFTWRTAAAAHVASYRAALGSSSASSAT